MSSRETITTGDFVKATAVAPRTAIFWVDSWFDFCSRHNKGDSEIIAAEKLQGLRWTYRRNPQAFEKESHMVRTVLNGAAPPYHIPGSKDRRVPTQTAIAFCEAAHMQQAAEILKKHLSDGTAIVAPEDQLTTGEIAQFANVAPKTAAHWVDACLNGDQTHPMTQAAIGKSPPYILPHCQSKKMQSHERRIPLSTFKAFCHKSGMNYIVENLQGQPKIIYITSEPNPDLASFKSILNGHAACQVAHSAVDGLKIIDRCFIENKRPIVIAHHSLGDTQMSALTISVNGTHPIIGIIKPGQVSSIKFSKTCPDDGTADIDAAKAVGEFIANPRASSHYR